METKKILTLVLLTIGFVCCGLSAIMSIVQLTQGKEVNIFVMIAMIFLTIMDAVLITLILSGKVLND